jgi:8-oxo-dGTP diphosphatase
MTEHVEGIGGKIVYESRKAVVAYKNRILLLKLDLDNLTLGHDALDGDWDLPGGRINEGESAEDALKREVREEVGIEVSVVSDLNDFEFYPSSGVVVRGKNLFCMASSDCVVLDKTRSKQHSSYIWASTEDAASYSMPTWMKKGIKLSERYMQR